MRLWLLALLPSCSSLVAGRVSTGVTATSDGSVGVAISGELAGGYLLTAHRGDARGHGETVALLAGGAATTAGGELTAGGRVDYVTVGPSELRAGAVVAATIRDTATRLEPLLAVGVAHPVRGDGGLLVGLELRGGPQVALDGDPRIAGARCYLGITFEAIRIGGGRYDPIEKLIERSGK